MKGRNEGHEWQGLERTLVVGHSSGASWNPSIGLDVLQDDVRVDIARDTPASLFVLLLSVIYTKSQLRRLFTSPTIYQK